MIYLLGLVAGVLGLSLFMNWRQSRTNGKLAAEIAGLKASVGVKDAQLKIYANARPGDGARRLGDGSF